MQFERRRIQNINLKLVFEVLDLTGPNSNIIAIDHSAGKLQLAEKLGANHTVNSKESQDIKSEIFKITEDKGVNAVIDCVGA